jgi:hypothetical protein
MANIWQAPADIKKLIDSIKEEHHTHLAAASIWALCSDGAAIRDNQLVATQTKKCTSTEKLSTGCDFKIIVMMETWSKLTDPQRKIAIDEALTRCGVKRVPMMVEVNGKKEPVKDDLGRTIYSDEMDYDKLGNPKWKINQPDAGLYFGMLMRHGEYSEQAENVIRAINGKPLKLPIAAEQEMLEELEDVA